MKIKNTPLNMNADDIALLAMVQLRGSGKLNDNNVDCFIQGYKSCSDALTVEMNLLTIFKHHYKEFSIVEESIDYSIHHKGCRSSRTADETACINRANNIAEALKNLIDVFEEYSK